MFYNLPNIQPATHPNLNEKTFLDELINYSLENLKNLEFVPNVDMDIKELSKLWQETHCEEIYRNAELMPNVKEEFKLLKEWTRTQRPGYQYVCVTAQMPFNTCHTHYWLGKHYFNFLEVYISNHKHKIDIDLLVDDSPKNYDKWVAAGRDEASYILFDRPYNQDCPATNRIYKLSDLINILKIKA